MIDVVQDAEGVRIALEEIFEEDFTRAGVGNMVNASEETRKRLADNLPARTLSPGYYDFAAHLLWLEDERKAGIAFVENALAAFEVRGLVALGRARNAFDSRHPKCSSCGARQQNRFAVECIGCGVKFRRKGDR